MPTIRDVYKDAVNSSGPKVEEMAIRLLLAEVNHIQTMSDLYILMDNPMKGLDDFRRLFARVIAGEPVQYVLGKTNFCGLEIVLDNRVLIPRPETEGLVELAIKEISKSFPQGKITIADIGTGSGCIAFALEKAFLNAKIFATDISPEALEVARKNCLNLHSKVILLQGDTVNPLFKRSEKIDVLVSNPPYIENILDVDENVKKFEPGLALYAEHGIDYYESIIKQVRLILNDNGIIFFEINYDQEERLTSIVKKFLPHSYYKFTKDLQGKTRYLHVHYNKG